MPIQFRLIRSINIRIDYANKIKIQGHHLYISVSANHGVCYPCYAQSLLKNWQVTNILDTSTILNCHPHSLLSWLVFPASSWPLVRSVGVSHCLGLRYMCFVNLSIVTLCLWCRIKFFTLAEGNFHWFEKSQGGEEIINCSFRSLTLLLSVLLLHQGLVEGDRVRWWWSVYRC